MERRELSAGNPNLLSFVCPQCQKKLRAPSKLAGQKLACPQCSAAIRVPGNVPEKKDDDDWLSLDETPSPPRPVASPPPPSDRPSADVSQSPRVATPPEPKTPQLASDDDDFSLAPISNNQQKAAPKSATTSVPVPSEATDDEFGLEALSPNGTKKDVSPNGATKVAAEVGRSLFDDDLPDLTPLDSQEPPKRKATSSALPDLDVAGLPGFSLAPEEILATGIPMAAPSPPSGTNTALPSSSEMFDIPLAPLEPSNAGTRGRPKGGVSGASSNGNDSSKPSSPKLIGSLEEIMRESDALQSPQEKKEEEFSFKCKVCGTLLYAEKARVGSKTRCPDCFSEFNVPSPSARRKEPAFKPEPSADVTFAPVDAKSVHNEGSNKAKSNEMLQKAAAELRSEEKETEHLTVAFDSKRWIALVFWFMRDPLLDVVIVLLGLVCSAWLTATTMLPAMAGLDGLQAALFQAVLFLIPLIPIAITLLVLGSCVLSSTANQHPKIQDWPFTRLGDAFGEVFTMMTALALASIPGGLIGSITIPLTGTYLGTVFFTMLAIWGLVPFMILSMADNNSLLEPFSKAVYKSLTVKTDAWGAMYLQTAIAFLSMFTLAGIALLPGPLGEILSGLLLPFFVFFVFNQWGLLAGRISDVTELGFSGDFSQDNAE